MATTSRAILQLFLVVAFAVLSQGAPLRGSRRRDTDAKRADEESRRRLMEQQVTVDDDDDDDFVQTPMPTEFPTELTESPVVAPTAAPSLESQALTQAPTVAPVTTPQPTPQPTTPPTSALPPNARRLYPFTLRFEGDLEDEVAFRRDLELYMVSSMQRTVPSLQEISLQPVPVAFGQRSLQQASLLGYQGAAFLDSDVLLEAEVPTADDIQNAQLDTLEDSSSGALQEYLFRESSSSQVLTILQVQVSDFDPIAYDPVTFDPDAVDPDTRDPDAIDPITTGDVSGSSSATANSNSNSNGPTDDGKQGQDNMAIIIVGAIAGLFVAVVIVAYFLWHQHLKAPPPPSYGLGDNEHNLSVDDIVEINKSIKVAITESTSDSVGSPKSQSPGDSSNNADGSIEVIDVYSKPKRSWIDLRRPAKNSKGVESVAKEKAAPLRNGAHHDDGDGDSLFGNSMMDMRTIATNDDESMAGYSLTDGSELEITQSRLLDAWAKERAAQKNRDSPELKAQMKWFEHETKEYQQHRPVPSTGKRITRDVISNPLGDSMMSEEDETVVFTDDEEVEVVSMSDGYASSYKEDDSSIRGGSIVSMSEVSDSAFEHVYGSPGGANGALGYFYREQDEESDEDFDVLPPVPTLPMTEMIPDDQSDVPFDERPAQPPKAEQGWTSFSKVRSLEQELDGITGADAPASTDIQEDNQGNYSQDNSMWEENPEMMEAWIRERRRIKRQARNRREERKQPPLTMEI